MAILTHSLLKPCIIVCYIDVEVRRRIGIEVRLRHALYIVLLLWLRYALHIVLLVKWAVIEREIINHL